VKALVCPELGPEEVLRVEDLPDPECGPSQVRIGVEAASVNFPDTLVIRGEYQYKYDPPFVPGHECSGTLLEVGADVDGLSVGDRVLAMTGVGAFASQVVARPPRADQVFRIPDAMSWDEAAALNLTYGTAILGLARRAQLQPGESVLVLGAAGGTGSAAVQVAKAMGAYVIGAAGGAEKLAIAERCGADAVVDYREDGLSARVKELTGGRGADVVFDPVGGSDFREYLRSVAWNGRYLVVGFAGGEIPTVGLNLVLLKSVSIVGVAYGAAARLDPAANAENFAQLFRWYDEGLLHPVIGQRFPLEDAAEALRVVSGRSALGKVIIDIGDGPGTA
jgi:NADPH2:quinone reductase